MKKKIMFIFGTRPEAIKMAPLIRELQRQRRRLAPLIVVTGQHRQMLEQVLKLFRIKPDYDLGIMQDNQTVTHIVSRSLLGLAEIIKKERPEMMLVQGDTSTAFAAALTAYYYRIPLGHVEAGLRTGDKWRPFPEEMNRKLITALADLHFAPTADSAKNLLAEKVDQHQIFITGNTVIDALLAVASRPYRLPFKLEPGKKLVLITTHRRESWGAPMRRACRAIARLAKEQRNQIQIVVPVHRNPRVKDVVFAALQKIKNIKLVEPLDYEPFVHLMKKAYIIITDSGGIQEEGPSLGKPVLVLREKTERPEAVQGGTVKLVGTDPKLIYREANRLLTDRAYYDRMAKAVNPYGDGQAAKRTIKAILYYFGLAKQRPAEFRVTQ